jgi:TPR repeat protein
VTRWHGLAILLLTALPVPAATQDLKSQCRSEAERGVMTACERAISIAPNDPELHALLGQAYFAGGFYTEGLRAFRQAIETSHGDPAYRYRFAGFAALINDYPQAAEELERAVVDAPGKVRYWVLLADCYRYMKNASGALKAGRRAAELGDPSEAYMLAMRYGSGEGLPADHGEELRWLEKSASAGYVAAMQELARFYADGRPGMPPNPAKRKYWEAAAKKALN